MKNHNYKSATHMVYPHATFPISPRNYGASQVPSLGRGPLGHGATESTITKILLHLIHNRGLFLGTPMLIDFAPGLANTVHDFVTSLQSINSYELRAHPGRTMTTKLNYQSLLGSPYCTHLTKMKEQDLSASRDMLTFHVAGTCNKQTVSLRRRV